jgi:hypothetical protein
MSRAYRIAVKESLARTVQVDDGVCSSLELLPILEKERMRELLAAELAQHGFTREGDTARRRQAGDVLVEIDLGSGEISVTAEGHADLKLEAERVSVVAEEVAASHERVLREQARASLEREAKAEEEALRRKVTEQLEGALRNLKEELDGVVNRVTAAALKQRASELGEVQEVHEEPNGSLTIKVRV